MFWKFCISINKNTCFKIISVKAWYRFTFFSVKEKDKYKMQIRNQDLMLLLLSQEFKQTQALSSDIMKCGLFKKQALISAPVGQKRGGVV